MKARFVMTFLVGVLVLAACDGSAEGSSGDPIEGRDVVVHMFDNRFEYTEIRIPVGGSVEWLGAGRNPHNSRAADDSWSTEAVFGSLDQFDGDSAVITYDEPGEYIFFCTYHGNAGGSGMSGVLIVGDDSS